MQNHGKVGQSNMCKHLTEWDTLMCDTLYTPECSGNYLTKNMMPKIANKISATGTFAIVGFA